MRTTIKRAIPLFLLVTILLSLAAPASARASTHFSSAGVSVTAKGSGKLQIEMVARATEKMISLGVSYVNIKEKQPNGTYRTVKTYTSSTNPSLIQKNRISFHALLTYQGKSGKTYQVTVTFRAENSTATTTVMRTSRAIVV